MQKKSGIPIPLGLSFYENEVNFSLHAPYASTCALLIYDAEQNLLETIPFDPMFNKTGSIWHMELEYEPYENKQYLYLLDGSKTALDPYAKFLNSSPIWGEGAKVEKTKGVIRKIPPFDWGSIKAPSYQMKDLIIYEMHVRGFTLKADVQHPGTFLGIIEKIPYLKSLGINAVELMPIHEFNECENPHEGLYNYWGYSPVAYFAFMQRYGTKEASVLVEFKTLVKALHEAGIALIIDVVYNHTAEGGASGPSYHLKNLDPGYYLKDKNGRFCDYTGCGNTLDANRNPAFNLIIDSLSYLALECHVDGFRFDLASTFYRDVNDVLSHPRIIETLLDHPLLSKKILIAEAWDAKGLYQVGHFPKPFADWNGAYRDKIRAFLNGLPHSKGGFADALSGTASLYFSKTPDLSINFITAHDGFTLHDLFSYNQKHNLANKENNQDGSNQNLSYNWGQEGPSDRSDIQSVRQKLMALSLALLFLSLGTPMMLMGDEYGHSRGGNNNSYCQDNDLNYFQWDKLDPLMIGYIHDLIALRQKITPLSGTKFFDKQTISWHGTSFDNPAWQSDDSFLALHIHEGYLIVINNSTSSKNFLFPQGSWTQLLSSHTLKAEKKHLQDTTHYLIEPHTLAVFEAK